MHSPVYIDDLVDGVVRAATTPEAHEVIDRREGDLVAAAAQATSPPTISPRAGGRPRNGCALKAWSDICLAR